MSFRIGSKFTARVCASGVRGEAPTRGWGVLNHKKNFIVLPPHNSS